MSRRPSSQIGAYWVAKNGLRGGQFDDPSSRARGKLAPKLDPEEFWGTEALERLRQSGKIWIPGVGLDNQQPNRS